MKIVTITVTAPSLISVARLVSSVHDAVLCAAPAATCSQQQSNTKTLPSCCKISSMRHPYPTPAKEENGRRDGKRTGLERGREKRKREIGGHRKSKERRGEGMGRGEERKNRVIGQNGKVNRQRGRRKIGKGREQQGKGKRGM